jgi:UDP-2-acetamido-2,6-beta-L-arabino-hexul-4-ose reductase
MEEINKMKKIGITGQQGFVGKHLYNTLGLSPDKYERIEFKRDYFENESKLNEFVSKCDVIVHLAAMNRHENPQVIYDTNIELVEKLIQSCETTGSKPHIIFSSSSQEEKDNLYGKSKKNGRDLFYHWSIEVGATFSGLIIPNVFGPFGKPFYNSVVATFSHQVANNEIPKIDVDGNLKLIFVSELVGEILQKIKEAKTEAIYLIPHTKEIKVSGILNLLESFKNNYQEKGEIPTIHNSFELNLFNTFRSYINLKNHFPVKYTQHTDPRGSFVEIIRLGVGGQVSFSTTVPNITRGNHYHTRKIERFSVIKGKALIQLRKIGTEEVLNFYLDGNEPSYVDMPIWYTHNIKNIGEEILYTNFWINEFYNPEDTDTYFEEV